jgi:hypothetical protein
VFLNGARAAPEDLADLAVAFPGSDPFHDFELAFGEGARSFRIGGSAFVNSRRSAVPGGHGKMLLTEGGSLVHTHNGVYRRPQSAGDSGPDSAHYSADDSWKFISSDIS